MKQTEQEKCFITRRALAERWKCSQETIKRRGIDGTLPTHHIGALVRYDIADVERIEKEGRVTR